MTTLRRPSAKVEDKLSETSSGTTGSTPSLDAVSQGKERTSANSVGGNKDAKDGHTRKLNLKLSFRTLSSQKKVEKVQDKNEPSRFLGEGVSFKAKLIGILEVNEARGDRMCQEALADLKMAIRAAGEHKQRITINIAIDGLRLRDEKNGDCLYHHPVHKISFIAQDMSDSRAFGYIFGSPDTGHRFFGIKTDKAASQVVIAMRDLFQVVFELKKKEIEMAKQHIEQHQIKGSGGMFADSGSSSKNGIGGSEPAPTKSRTIREETVKENGNASASGSAKSTHKASEVIADLLDLEFELNSIQQGIHQMERITPSDPFGPSSTKDSVNKDPFGDSFAPTATLPPPPKTVKQSVSIFPPPPAAKEPSPRVSDPFNVPPPSRQPQRRGGVRNRTAAAERFNTAVADANKTVEPAPASVQQEKHWFDKETESLFGEGELVPPQLVSTATATTTFATLSEPVGNENRISPNLQMGQFDVFTDLDPLGTGRSKPYVDRKDFFQDLKNPPKKVLKDLCTEAPSEATAPLFQATFDSGSNRHSGASDGLETNTTIGSNTSLTGNEVASFPMASAGDPFYEGDPFYRTDPFENADINRIAAFPPISNNADPFDTGFADFTMFGRGRKSNLETAIEKNSQESAMQRASPQPDASQSVFSPRTNFHGPLRVSLPPEKSGANSDTSATLPSSSRQTAIRSSGNLSKPRNKSRLHKQTTLSGLPKLPSPKSSQRSSRLAKQMTVDGSTSRSHSLHPSPTPPTPPTPQRYDRRSPASHLESVTLRNRCAITPSPPVVACFPDMDGHSSRLSGSSAEFSEIAPEPPPRPASNIALIKPPPLPPKRQQAGSIMRPPPRPPHTEDHPHYDYIENYETSTSPTPLESEELKSPPIPVPARRPRFSPDDAANAPQRPRRNHPVIATLSNKSSDEDYLTPIPFPLLPPPQKRNQDGSKISKSYIPSVPAVPTTLAPLFPPSAIETKQEQTGATSSSLNLTLSQLTKTGFSDLATTLGISPSQLSNMTLQELTKCLSKLSSDSNPVAEEIVETTEESHAENAVVKREKYAALRESVDEEPIFKAEFENNFEDMETFEKPTEEVFQETLFDKYAVFRELINEEKTEEEPEVTQEDVSGSIVVTETEEVSEINLENKTVIAVNNSPAITSESADRYAALRDISIDDDAGAFSDKEESIAEVTRIDDDEDLLTLSRQHSESTESPTMETATMKGEQLSMIETTIYEEDVSTLDADDEAFEDVPDIMEDVEELEEEEEDKEVKDTPSQSESKDSMDPELVPDAAVVASPSPEEMKEIQPLPDIQIKEEVTSGDSWAKFDTSAFPPDKPTSELPSEGASPWSSDGKEFGKVQSPAWQEHFNEDTDRGRRRRKEGRSPWQEDESEEGGNERRPGDGPWRENGWSDGEPYYEDDPRRGERVYHDDRSGRRRRVSPWKKGQRSSRDASPWEHGRYQDPRSMDDEEDDEEYEYWKTRPNHRGSSWDDERRRRFEPPPRDINGLEYDEGRKRRPLPWGAEGDRRSSRESVNWEDEERYSQREYSDRRPRDREDDYRRRRDPEGDPRGYAWTRKEGDYSRREPSRRPPETGRRYYRDRSRESPWEDEYSEHGDDDSPQYTNAKRNWPSKRPSSASEARRTSDKSPGEFKSRDKAQYSLPVTRSVGEREGGEKGGAPERRYRDTCCARPQSREGHFNSDQEYEYWPERPRRESGGYEQRSQTLHTRRPNKCKKAQERSYSQKSPFDDDFSSHPLSVSSSDIIKSQGGESDASENFRKKSPINPAALFSYTDSFPRRRDQYTEDIRTNEMVPSSPLELPDSPLEDSGRSRMSRSSYSRQSPFEDDFTPPDTRPTSGRRVSSVSSEVSDNRRSPYDDVRGSRRVPSVAEEREGDNDALDLKNGRISDDVFLESRTDLVVEQRFADFDNSAFTNNSGLGDLGVNRPATESRRAERRVQGSMKGADESRKHDKFVPAKGRLTNLKADPLNIKKSESVNIFTREKDPFDDDDFFNSQAPSGSAHSRPRQEHSSRNTDKPSTNNNGDPFKWTKAFESFNFDEEK